MLSRNERYQEISPTHVSDVSGDVGTIGTISVGTTIGVGVVSAVDSMSAVGVTVREVGSTVYSKGEGVSSTTGKKAGSCVAIAAEAVVSTKSAGEQDTSPMIIRKGKRVETFFI
jgi:hypothetical protein